MVDTPTTIHKGRSHPWAVWFLFQMAVVSLGVFVASVLTPGCDCKTGARLEITTTAWVMATLGILVMLILEWHINQMILGVSLRGLGDHLEITVQSVPLGNLVFTTPTSNIEYVGFSSVPDGEGGFQAIAHMSIGGLGSLRLLDWKEDDVRRLSDYCQLPQFEVKDDYPREGLTYRKLRQMLKGSPSWADKPAA